MAKERLPQELKKEIRAKAAYLRPLMPRGTVQTIAKELDFSHQYVSDVLAGRRWDLDVLEKLIAVGEKNLKRAEIIDKKLDKIIEKSRKTTK